MSADAAVDGLRILPTQHTVADVLSRVQSLARARGLTVFAQIDFSGDAERSGLPMLPAGLVILGSPKAGTPLMVSAPSTALDLPLKILVAETETGKVLLFWNDAAWLQDRHYFSEELAINLATAQALAAAAAG